MLFKNKDFIIMINKYKESQKLKHELDKQVNYKQLFFNNRINNSLRS